ncbi:MAG TPA: MFS transporter [Kofleriaceae bacterium]|nr:MFS transporter [Kofleriaceae bacterium]
MVEPSAPKPPPAWLFALTGMPYGVVGSFSGAVMPYLARRAGFSVDDIGWYVSLLLVPPVVQFLYTPIVDVGPKRKHWLMIVTFLGAACLVAATLTPLPDQLTLFLAFAFAAQTISGLVGSCNGGLMANSVPDHRRGAAAAWYNVGNLCGGGISAAIAVYMTGHGWAPLTIGLVLAGMMVLPSFAALAVREPAREHQSIGQVFGALLSDVRGIVTSRIGITGILLCLSPVGTAALANYFGSIAIDYVRPELGIVPATPAAADLVGHMLLLDPSEVTRVANELMTSIVADEKTSELLALATGLVGQILIAVGALAGGWLCDRYNRRVMYLTSGTLTAIVGIIMALSPRTETTFLWGVYVYQLVMGFCYAAFSATVLETIGKGSKAASTKYSMFVASGNLAILYVGLVDSRFHESHGVEGVVAADSALNIAGVIVLALVFWSLGAFGRWRHVREPDDAKA